MTGSKPLTPDEKAQAFRQAASFFGECNAEKIVLGMNDAELADALKSYFGIYGGSGGPDCISIAYQGSGLKIWATWDSVNSCVDKPMLQGMATVREWLPFVWPAKSTESPTLPIRKCRSYERHLPDRILGIYG